MRPAPSKVTFATFKEAFCHYHQCPPEEFEKRVLFQCLAPFRRPLAWPIWWFNRGVFAVDIDAIQTMGRTGSRHEASLCLDEFHNSNKIERGFRRGAMGIRVSGTKLMALRKKLDPWIETPPDTTANALTPGTTALAPAERGPGPLRRLRSVHQAVTGGRTVEEAAQELGWTPDELFAELETAAPGQPQLEWLRDLMRRERRLAAAEAEVKRLRSALEAQAAELEELRHRPPGA